MKTKLRILLLRAANVINEYPMVITMAFLAAVSAMIGVDSTNDQENFEVVKLTFVLCLGISLMFAVKVISQRFGKELVWTVVAILLLLAFYFYLPSKATEFTEMYAFVLVPTFVLSHLLVSFSAFIGQRRQMDFWNFNKNLLVNVILTAIFTGVLVAGVLLAIKAIDELFQLNMSSDRYPQTFFYLSIFGSCFIFLLFSGVGLKKLERDENYPEILKFFTQFILIPLLLLYAVILYVYAGKILIQWELPRGWVSYLILAYSLVGIFALLLVFPLKESGSKAWVKGFSKAFYYTLIPLLVLLYVAIFTRILEYGFTEARYYVLLLALWITLIVVYFVAFKRTNIKVIPMSLFAFGLFALVFPFLNAIAFSIQDQKNDLTEILTREKVLQKGKIDFQKEIPSTSADEIGSKLSYLLTRKQKEFVLGLLPTYVRNDKELKSDTYYVDPFFFTKQFKSLVYNTSEHEIADEKKIVEIVTSKNSYNLTGFDYLFVANSSHKNIFEFDGTVLEFQSTQENPDYFTFLLNGTSYSIENEVKNEIIKYKNASGSEVQKVNEIKVVKTIQDYELTFYFDKINYDPLRKPSSMSVFGIGVLIMVKKK